MRPLVLAPRATDCARLPAYTFRGARGRTSWPMGEGVGLGAVGMWNFLWRLGFHPRQVDLPTLPAAAPDDVLFAQLDEAGDVLQTESLRRWSAAGRKLVVAGDPAACAAVVDPGGAWERIRIEHPYSGLAHVDTGGPPSLVAPAGWACTRIPSNPSVPVLRRIGAVASVGGERQTPSRALVSPIADAPAIVVRGATAFLNASPFAAFQAWVQGQEDLVPWLAWRHRMLWLDAWVSDMATLLASLGVLALDAPRPGIAALPRTTVVLRHDVDYSRDTAYLDDEDAQGFAGTHALLLDDNARFWVDRLAASSRHEAAFHYSTGRRDWIGTAAHVWRGQRGSVLAPDLRAVTGLGLLRQVRRAQAAGIGVATLHRHLAFLPYPEWVDALDAVFAAQPQVLGGSSLFRASVLRWGRDRIDGKVATLADWPDAHFPLWLPFRLAHAGDGGRALRGWETCSLMEAEPELVDRLLGERLPHVHQRVFTLGYHPAHAAGDTFAASGYRDAFRAVLNVVRDHQAAVHPLREVYRRANEAIGA